MLLELGGFIEVDNKEHRDLCIDVARKALERTGHVVRVTSVAKMASFCTYYARMSERMGVRDIVVGKIPGKGTDIHRVLGLAALLHFKGNKDVKEAINDAIEELVRLGFREERLRNEDTVETTYKLLYRLKVLLPDLKKFLGLSEDAEVEPITEQQFIDYRFHIVGSPDLILEFPEDKKALVIDWKTTRKSPSMYEEAQVIAYALMETRRLGYESLQGIYEAVTGVEWETLKEIARAVGRLRDLARRNKLGSWDRLVSDLGVYRGLDRDGRKAVDDFKYLLESLRERGREVFAEVRVLPLIIRPEVKLNLPPHPVLRERPLHRSIAKYIKDPTGVLVHKIGAYANYYDLIRKVIIAAEHLTLLISNIPVLAGYNMDELAELCRKSITIDGRTIEGLALTWTPRILPRGRPKDQDEVRKCRACPLREPCKFYFGTPEKGLEDFDRIIWWKRFKIFEEREKDLAPYKALDLLMSKTGDEFVSHITEGDSFEVDLYSGIIRQRKRPKQRIIAKKGGEPVASFKIDVLEDVDIGQDDYTIVFTRKLREYEKDKVIRLSKTAYFVLLDRPQTPLLSRGFFGAISDVDYASDNIVYVVRPPSMFLLYQFALFRKYIELEADWKRKWRIVAFEAPVDMTTIELRTLDSMQRYLRDLEEEEKLLRRKAVKRSDIKDFERHLKDVLALRVLGGKR